ncbi:MAG: hypothetical protein Q8934_18280 [Bacillota bacterium]|nr:hypothetical protein [Bacillota bacterium]
MKKKETSLRSIVGCLVIVLVFGLGYAFFSGKKQDEQFANVQAIYNQSLQLYKQGQYGKALPLLRQVEGIQTDSYAVRYNTGLALANTRDWNGAATEFKNVLDINPNNVEDPVFMLQFAEILTFAKKNDEAKMVLARCENLPIPQQIPDYKNEVNVLLAQLSASSR